MKTYKRTDFLNMRNPDGTIMSTAEKIATLPPKLIVNAFEAHARLSEASAHKKTMNEVVCRLLASGMPSDEIAIILCVKAENVDDSVKYGKDNIAKYAKQLKGRRQRAKKKQDGN
jgi:hypothetical protein